MHRRRTSIESLEKRVFLAANPIPVRMVDGNAIATVAWQGQQQDMFAGRWIVQLEGFAGNLNDQQRRFGDVLAAQQKGTFDVERHMGSNGLFLVRGPEQLQPQEVLAKLATLPGFKFAEPDFLYQLQLTPNDTTYSQLWGLHNTGQTAGTPDADIDAPEAWDITTGSSSTVVGMVDSGIDYNHPDLAANIWTNPFEIAGNGIDDEGNGYVDDVRGWDWWGNLTSDGPGDSDPLDQNGHGTHTAGTVGAVGNNGVGVTGVNWNVKMMALKIGGPGNAVSGADAVSAMNYILDMKNRGVNVRVSNHSWGGGPSSSAMNNAIAAHATNGILMVCAAGNNGSNTDATPFYPAGYNQPNVISVGNMTHTNTRSSTSNFGLTSVDLFAPGTNIRSTTRNNTYGNLSGTSMAAPHVTGVVALCFTVANTATFAQVRTAIFSSVEAVPAFATISVTGGRLNAPGALNNLAAVPAAPAQPNLDDASDTGAFNDDNVTNDDTPTFTGGGATVGHTILIFANGVQVGSAAVAAGGTWSVTTSPLTDGVKQITARAQLGVVTSADSPALPVTLDTVAPTVSSPQYFYSESPHSLSATFNENVGASLVNADLEVANLDTPGTVTLAHTYDTALGTLGVSFPGTPVLADANYRFTIKSSGPGGGVQDLAGNTVAEFMHDFFFLMGDANHDGIVNLGDFNILAANFGQNLRDFTQGDFTYDLRVDLADFNVLANRFGSQLSVASRGPSTPFGGTKIGAGKENDNPLDDLLA